MRNASAILLETLMRAAAERPRDRAEAEAAILAAVQDETLCREGTFVYRGEEGELVVAPGIRLVEAMFQAWRNVTAGVEVVQAGETHSDVRSYAVDLETLQADERTVQVRHVNDRGNRITDQRDIHEVVMGAGAKNKRACMLAILPGEFVRQVLAWVDDTLVREAEVTPEACAQVVDRLARHQVSRDHIDTFLGHQALDPAGLVRLQRIANSLDERATRPWDWFDIERPKAPPRTRTLADIRGDSPGESAEASPPPPAPPAPAGTTPFQRMVAAIRGATSKDQLEAQANLVHAFPDADDRKALDAEVSDRRKALKN